MSPLANEDYEVYSSVLSAFFGDHPAMAILDRTGCSWRWEQLEPEFCTLQIRRVLHENPELASDFQTQNGEPAVVEDRISPAVGYTIIPSSERCAGWQLSRVGFSTSRRFALVSVVFVGQPGAASGMLVLCERNGADWSCEKIVEWCS